MAGIASARVTRNFVSKNGLRIADMKSGRMPSVTSNIAATTGSVTNKAIASCVLTETRPLIVVGGERLNQAIGIHGQSFRSLAARLASPRCNATRTAPSVIDNFDAVVLMDALSTAIDRNTSRCRGGRSAR